MLGRARGGPSSTKPHAKGAVATIITDGGQEATVSQFVAQLGEATRRRLDSMHQRLRLLEQQMEALEAEVGKVRSTDAYA